MVSFEIFPVTCTLFITSYKKIKITRFILSITFEGINGSYLSFDTNRDFKNKLSTIFKSLKHKGVDQFCTNKMSSDYLKKLDGLYHKTEQLGFEDSEYTVELWSNAYERTYTLKANNSQEILDFYNNVTTI